MKAKFKQSPCACDRDVNSECSGGQAFCKWLMFVCVMFTTLVIGGDAQSKESCDVAARIASAKVGVPFEVLQAVTRSETGRTVGGKLQPWPWTVNMEGVGKWFDSREDALSYVNSEYLNGSRSFDVGCFQINNRWHGENFNSFWEMFDPEKNARYAAIFLKKLHAEKGSWSLAVGAYHSRTEKYAERYRERYDEILASVLEDESYLTSPSKEGGGGEVKNAVTSRSPYVMNNYPLLQGGARNTKFSSLVPIDGGRARIIALSERRERWAEE